MSISKIIFNNESFIDLTSDTVDEQVLHDDFIAIGNDGTEIVGEEPYPSLENNIIEKTLSGTYTNTKLTSLVDYAFMGQSQLIDVSIGELTTIPQYAFYGCSSLNNISDISNVTTIGAYALRGCTSLNNVDISNTTTIDAYALYGLTLSNNVDVSNLVTIGEAAFGYCNFTYFHAPKVTSLGYSAFTGCTLETIVLEKKFSTSPYSVFNNCKNLKAVDFNTTGQFSNGYFTNCSSLNMLVLRRSDKITPFVTGVGSCFNGSSFASTGAGGTLYVPESLISSYQSASNWSTLLGYENNQIKSIESTHTDPDAPIDLTLYYVDGTPIKQQS